MASDEFFALVRAWLTIHLPRARRLSPHTIRSYKTALNTLLDFLRENRHLTLAEVSFEAIDRATITAFFTWLLDTQHLSGSSANQRLAAIKSFLSYCAGEDPAPVSIWLGVRQVKPARTPARAPDGLSMPAVDALIRARGQNTNRGRRDTTLILLMFDAAARIQEMLDLTPADIDTTVGAARVTLTGKGHKIRTVPLMDKTARHREQYLAEFHPGTPDAASLLFFTIRAGHRQQMSQDNITYLLNKHAAIAQQECPEVPEKIHAHQLRHARAMQMLRAGVPLPHIKEFLGHANIATTSIYASADNEMVREAIQKAGSANPELAPLWTGGDNLILQLAGLK
ncbi:tyrosine-type recombinase/integrase [Cryobacterium sp. 5B3]|uniref:tyrosine-type recombinase/integrase n=1 Tax=Cryobacterium sp. 5B3 TaxID=3048586 RepID=UPI002AB531BF|nr:tyrosine-type recombinase/integrase [Cryobacterium sp. 5B3]MDY7540906.1 tyrosine-type recombinase/integrase [Cryobacterium sp. 5B3]MEB0276413.1 tyrosine-type recombinase/integrase [Cryobacterium sp. 5B3]